MGYWPPSMTTRRGSWRSSRHRRSGRMCATIRSARSSGLHCSNSPDGGDRSMRKRRCRAGCPTEDWSPMGTVSSGYQPLEGRRLRAEVGTSPFLGSWVNI